MNNYFNPSLHLTSHRFHHLEINGVSRFAIDDDAIDGANVTERIELQSPSSSSSSSSALNPAEVLSSRCLDATTTTIKNPSAKIAHLVEKFLTATDFGC